MKDKRQVLRAASETVTNLKEMVATPPNKHTQTVHDDLVKVLRSFKTVSTKIETSHLQGAELSEVVIYALAEKLDNAYHAYNEAKSWYARMLGTRKPKKNTEATE